MARLSKTQTVMYLRSGYKHAVQFNCVNETDTPEDIFRSHILNLDKEIWHDMGEPKTITVTIVPGDALNEEADGA